MGTVVLLALFAAVDPVRLGIAALLVSRPRPMLNLLAYWLGAMATGTTAVVGLLLLLHDFAPTFMQTVSAALASSTARHARIMLGLIALPLAVLIAVGLPARRSRALVAAGGPSVQTLPHRKPGAITRLAGRARDLLEDGPLWVAFVVGLGHGPPAEAYPVVIAAIAAAGSSIGTQFGATIIFMTGLLAVVEIPLISSLVAPARTQMVMLQVHDWVRARRRKIIATMVAAVGVLLVTTGVGSA